MVKICKVCGELFEAASNSAAYCSDECKATVRENRKKSKIEKHEKATLKLKEQLKRLEHQCDRGVWGTNPNEYAERQKAKTLALMSKITLDGDTFTASVGNAASETVTEAHKRAENRPVDVL